VVSIGGLAKGEDPGLAATIGDLLSAIAQRSGTTGPSPADSSTTGTSTTGTSTTGTSTDGSGTKP
jgi:hypothetical protein